MTERTYGVNQWTLAQIEASARDCDDEVDYEMAAHIRELQAEVDRLSAWADNDKQLPEDEAILTAHPLQTHRHDLHDEALRLVGAKRSKFALVALVNWLLYENANLKAERREFGLRVAERVEKAIKLQEYYPVNLRGIVEQELAK